MILEEFDFSKDAVINPEMVVKNINNFPEVTISCFSNRLFTNVLATFDAKLIGNIRSAVGLLSRQKQYVMRGRVIIMQRQVIL